MRVFERGRNEEREGSGELKQLKLERTPSSFPFPLFARCILLQCKVCQGSRSVVLQDNRFEVVWCELRSYDAMGALCRSLKQRVSCDLFNFKLRELTVR